VVKERIGNHKIVKHHLIICEGKDDVALLTLFSKSFMPSWDDHIQVIGTEGKDNIRPFLKLLPSLPSFEMLKSLVIIRDADSNPEGASRSIQDALGSAGFSVPNGLCKAASGSGANEAIKHVKVAYALFPKFDQMNANGAIENLCMDILNFSQNVSLKKILAIANDSLKKVEECGIKLSHRHKNELHTYFSLTNEFVGKQLRYAAQENAFDFSASAFDPLKKLMLEMIGDQ
jgi:5S rRNA maturation endonuclease (ribonuclease M5)